MLLLKTTRGCVRARLEAGKFCSESESSEMISVYQESISGAAVWLANGRI